MSIRVRTLMVGIALFLMGAVTGGAMMRIHDLRAARDLMRLPPEPRRSKFLSFVLKRRLDLTPDQLQALHAALDAQQPLVAEQERIAQPGRQQLRQDLVERCRAFLTPGQLERLERMVREVRQRESGSH